MANVPYAGGVADAQPDARPPDDYQRIEANPSSFGGAIAQGAEKFGAGAVDVSKFWGHVQADDASNNAQKEASDLAEHIRTLQGQDALDAQQGAYKSLDAIYAKYRNQLGTPEQQHIFDGQNRPFFDRYVRGQMNTTFVDAGRQFATKTADAGIEIAHSMAATAGSDGNWPAVEVSYHKALSSEIKKLQLGGMANDPDAVSAAKDKAALVYKSGIEGMLLKNPDGAQAKLDDPSIKAALGAAYEPLAKTVQAGVAHAYISKADALEANDPAKAEPFVRANEAKFGPLFGEALLKAKRATIEGQGKDLAAGSDGAVGSGWGPKAHAPVPANAMHFGDSLATGTAAAQYGEGWRSNPDVKAEVGKRPEGVLGQLKAASEGNPNAFAGRDVVLSTGTSNLRAGGAWDRADFDATGVKTVGEQLDTLRAGGADMSRVRVLGVGPKAGGDYANQRLQATAARYGAKFSAIPAGDYGPDGVHTSGAGYRKFLGADVTPAAATGEASYVATPEKPEGLITPGNIDLSKRPVVKNSDGSISTVRTIGVEYGGKEVLIPTVAADGSRILSNQEAIEQFKKTGQHLGIFDTAEHGTAYAQSLHKAQEKEYVPAARNSASVDDLFNAFHGQESGGGRNITTSIDNAHGDMQIQPGTFASYAKPGERLDNRADNIAVGKRILADYAQRYNGDAARVAVAYFSGPGNVAPPGSPTPWLSNRHDGQGTFVSQYVNGILTRLGHPGIAAGAPPALGHGSLTADSGTARPGWEGAAPSTEAPAAAATEPAAFQPPPQPPVPPQTSEEIVNAVYEQSARRLQWIDAQDATFEAKEVAKRQVEQQQAYMLAATAEKQAAIKAREDEASNDVLGTARKEGYTAAYQKLNAYMSDPRRPLSEKHFDTLSDVLERRSGNPNPIAYGAKYADALKNIVEPKDETQRISDPREILKMEANGELTAKGADHLLSVVERMKKSTSELGMQQREAGVLSYAKDYLDKSVNEPFMQIKDPEGKGIYELKFLNMFYSQLDNWRNANKNLADFPLFDQKKLDQMLQELRPRSKINQFNIQAGAMQPFQPEAPGTPIPAAPENTDAGAWQGLMQKPPTVGGQPIPHAVWGKVLTALAADPRPQVVASFDKYFGPGGFDGAKIAAALNAKARPAAAPSGQPPAGPDTFLPLDSGQ